AVAALEPARDVARGLGGWIQRVARVLPDIADGLPGLLGFCGDRLGGGCACSERDDDQCWTDQHATELRHAARRGNGEGALTGALTWTHSERKPGLLVQLSIHRSNGF
ncbi:MAG TPA: hypothetical protein VHT91_50110, partial [Kofleriaceae bacterium]|nr:hypothetical protein [Kofleriaceae bacterium]